MTTGDGFDISESTGIYIRGATVKNQDDCIAINSGEICSSLCLAEHRILRRHLLGGHGLSIGSVGGHDDNTVKNVTISDSTVTDSANGIRIKTVYGATGSVSEVTYSKIKPSGITDYGIVIEQNCENGSRTGAPTTGVPITDLTIDGVMGTVESDAVEVYILCGDGSCSDWT